MFETPYVSIVVWEESARSFEERPAQKSITGDLFNPPEWRMAQIQEEFEENTSEGGVRIILRPSGSLTLFLSRPRHSSVSETVYYETSHEGGGWWVWRSDGAENHNNPYVFGREEWELLWTGETILHPAVFRRENTLAVVFPDTEPAESPPANQLRQRPQRGIIGIGRKQR